MALVVLCWTIKKYVERMSQWQAPWETIGEWPVLSVLFDVLRTITDCVLSGIPSSIIFFTVESIVESVGGAAFSETLNFIGFGLGMKFGLFLLMSLWVVTLVAIQWWRKANSQR
jgi:hypothetical protein